MKSDEQEKLARYRTRFYSFSLLILFLKLAKVSLEKISFLGIELKIEESVFLYFTLWLFWFYWLLRYYQAFSEFGLIELKQNFRQFKKDKLDPLLRNYIELKKPNVVYNQIPQIDFLKKRSYFVYLYSGEENQQSIEDFNESGPPKFVLEIPVLRVFFINYVILLLKYPFVRTKFFDFVMPFLIGLIILIYCNYTSWSGSILCSFKGLLKHL